MKSLKISATVSISITCLSLLSYGWIFSAPASANFAPVYESFEAGELIEAPTDGTVSVSLGGIGSALLASGAQVRLLTTDSVLVASVLRGDLIVKLQSQSRALIKAGDTLFSPARGSLFHTGLRDGKAFIDNSDDLRDRLPELGNWVIKVPSLESTKPPAARSEKTPPISSPAGLLSSRRTLSLAAASKPIGRIESVGPVKINLNSTSHGSLLWGSELIQAPEGASARATLDGIAQVTLSSGSHARLATPTLSGPQASRVLAASLIKGNLVVQLSPAAAGVAEAAGATFLAARGARFRVMIIEGRAIFEMVEGVGFEKGEWPWASSQPLTELIKGITQTIAQDPTAQAIPRRYLVRPVGLNSNLVVRARSARQIQVRVTDENDRPVKGVPIIFLLDSSGGGSIGSLGPLATASSSARVFTDDAGIASVSFTAADAAVTGSISATVEGTNYSWVGQINLLKVSPGFWAPHNAVPVLATAAAAVTVGTIKAATKDDKLPVKPVGQPIIKP